MSKYDFGYELIAESTIKWAFDKVKIGSTVLELGPANGNLVYHLATEKKCQVDIVEIDEESGLQAARYARNSCLGWDEGNLENDTWFNKLKGNQYEYIVVLDVLEHVRNPQEVLTHLKALLKDDGCILLSIPNIAHNSVILNLLRNKFEYTPVGLLDDTHVHFYSYESVKTMLNANGLITLQEQVKQEKVGTNEIAADYGILPRSIEAYLKTRELGTAYQFLFTIQKGDAQPDTHLEYDKALDRLYEVVAFDVNSNSVLALETVNPLENIALEIDIPLGTKTLRIDPLNVNCIITDIKIDVLSNDNQNNRLAIKEFTGNQIGNLFVFYDDDPQIYVEIPEYVRRISFSCKCLDFDNEVLGQLIDLKDILRQYQSDLEESRKLIDQYANNIDEYAETVDKYVKTIDEHRLQYINVTNNLQSVNELLQEKELALQKLNEEYVQQEEQINHLTSMLENERIESLKLQDEKTQKENEIENLNTLLKEQEETSFKLNEELKKIQNTIWGKAYYKFNRDK